MPAPLHSSQGVKDAFFGALSSAFNNYLDLGAGVLILWYGGSIVMDDDGRISVGKLITYQVRAYRGMSYSRATRYYTFTPLSNLPSARSLSLPCSLSYSPARSLSSTGTCSTTASPPSPMSSTPSHARLEPPSASSPSSTSSQTSIRRAARTSAR